MTTRYYKVEDKALLNAISGHFDKRDKSVDKGNKLAEKHGFKKAGFIQDDMWGIHLAGFKCYFHDHAKREDKELWRRPVKDHTAPKSKKSDLNKEYDTACKELRIDGRAMEDLVGFGFLTYFPSSAGFSYKKDKNQFIFIMPESCDAVKGSKEITNIEFIELTKDR